MMMPTRLRPHLVSLVSLLGVCALMAAACSGGDEKAAGKDKKGAQGKDTKDTKDTKDVKADGGAATEATLEVAQDGATDEGPVPPDTSMVMFSVEGSLLPMACFDKDSGKIKAGKACLDMVPKEAEVRIGSGDTSIVKKVGAKVEPLCLTGSGKKIALAAEGIVGGANFRHAAWPRSAFKVIELVPDDTLLQQNLRLDEDEQGKIGAAIKAAGGAQGDVRAHQIAEFDLDGKDPVDKIYSAYVEDPNDAERFAWSGMFLAPGGDIEKLVLLEGEKKRPFTFELRGTVQLDGKGNRELWMRKIWEEGSGQRVAQLEGTQLTAFGKWSCKI